VATVREWEVDDARARAYQRALDSGFLNLSDGRTPTMAEPWQTIVQIIIDLGRLLLALVQFLGHWLLLIAWVAWWLGGAKWKKLWPTLAQGAWAPVVLLCVLAALVWSQIAPSSYNLLGVTVIPNFWWQLGAVGLIAGLALFCGWLQGVFGWTPPEISVEPAAHGGHDHGHGHH
jgi:hypothetical protein